MKKSLLLIICFLTMLGCTMDKIKTEETLSAPISAYIWDDVCSFEKQADNVFAKLAEKKFKTVYLSLDKYIDLTETDGANQNVEEYKKCLSSVIISGNKYSIRIEGLAGNTNWAEVDYKYIPNELIGFVKEYNSEFPNLKLSGMLWDIEFYNDKYFVKNKSRYALNYLDFVESITNYKDKNLSLDFRLGFAVPYWFSSSEEVLPKQMYKNEMKYMNFHLLDILSESDTNYLALMSYRDHAAGNNGSVMISKPTLDYAEKYDGKVGVIIAQETTKVDESNISYFGKSHNKLNEALEIIDQDLHKYNSYKGIAIHTAESYLEMSE